MAERELILISAMTPDRVIGKDRALPWSIPEEYEHFLRCVRGHVVVMGRTSYEIFSGDLADTAMVVVSSTLKSAANAEVCPSIDTAIARAFELGPRVFSAGGATIYRQTIDRADAMYLSFVKGDYTGDTRFPEFDESDWTITRRDDHPRFEYRVYERRAPERA